MLTTMTLVHKRVGVAQFLFKHCSHRPFGMRAFGRVIFKSKSINLLQGSSAILPVVSPVSTVAYQVHTPPEL